MNKIRTIFIILFTFLASLIIILTGLVLTAQHFGSKFVLNFINNELPKMTDKRLEVKNAKISLLTGQLSVDNLSSDLWVVSKNITFAADKLKLDVELIKALQKKFIIKKIRLEGPKININYAGQSVESKPSVPGIFLPKVEIKEIDIKNGTLTINMKDNKTFYVLSNVNASIENPFSAESADKLPVNVKVKGDIPLQKIGLLETTLKFSSFSPKLNFSGDFEIKDISLQYFYSLMNPAENTSVNGGTLNIKATLHCVDDWLTSSNIVSIDKLDVSTKEKKLFGIQTEMVTEFFKNNEVSFDLPVSGNVHSLRFDFSTAASQVLIKALQGKFKDEKFIVKVSDSLGAKIGTKLEKDLKNLLSPKK